MRQLKTPECRAGHDGYLFHPRAWVYYRGNCTVAGWHVLSSIAKARGYDVVGCTADNVKNGRALYIFRLRPGLTALKRAAKRKEIDVVVVTRLSQLSRRRDKLRKLLLYFERCRVTICTTECQLGYDLHRHGLDRMLS